MGPILVLILYSKWHFWWGGETYGPRLVSDITPFLCVYLYPVWEFIEQKRLLKSLFVILAILSMFMHSIGAFGFDQSWYKKNHVVVESDRLWSISDSPFVHYGKKLILKNLSFLRTGISSLPTSPQVPDKLTVSLVHQGIPSHHTTREPIRLSIVATNTGPAIWLFQTNNGRNGVRLGWRWLGIEGEGPDGEGRVPLPRDVFPGEQEEFNLEIWPPSLEGQYVLEIGMISEPTIWFGVQQVPIRITGSCHFEEVINTPQKFVHDSPQVGIVPHKSSYHTEEIGNVHLSIVNGSIPRNLKLYAFLRHPDGHLRSLNGAADLPPNPTCSQWIYMAAPNILSKYFRIDWQMGLHLSNMPTGLYNLYIFMTEPESIEVIAKSSSTFYLSPYSPEANTGNIIGVTGKSVQ